LNDIESQVKQALLAWQTRLNEQAQALAAGRAYLSGLVAVDANTLQRAKSAYRRCCELAIIVLTMTEQKLGYLPKFRNPVFARLMDAGKSLVTEVAQIKFGDDTVPAYLSESTDGTAIVDVRLRISLRE